MGPSGRCLSAFCIADNKAVVFPPDSCIKEAKSKGAVAGAGCCCNISGPIIGGCIRLLSITAGLSGCNDGSSLSLESLNPGNETIHKHVHMLLNRIYTKCKICKIICIICKPPFNMQNLPFQYATPGPQIWQRHIIAEPCEFFTISRSLVHISTLFYATMLCVDF